MFHLIIYIDGESVPVPINLSLLTPEVQAIYSPFAGKVVTWQGEHVVEVPDAR